MWRNYAADRVFATQVAAIMLFVGLYVAFRPYNIAKWHTNDEAVQQRLHKREQSHKKKAQRTEYQSRADNDMGMMTSVYHYRKIGLLPRQLWCQVVLGVYPGEAPAEVDQLAHLVSHMPADMKWSAFGIGKDHLKIMYAALALGADGIRVGLEDNIWYSKGELATNLSLAERAVRVIREFDCEPATPAEAREILGIKPLVR